MNNGESVLGRSESDFRFYGGNVRGLRAGYFLLTRGPPTPLLPGLSKYCIVCIAAAVCLHRYPSIESEYSKKKDKKVRG